MKSVFTDTDAEAEIQRINDEIARQDQEIGQRQNEQILQRDQTCALCDVCGRELGISNAKIAKSQVMHGTLMSPTWQKAVKRIEQRGKRREESA